MLSSSLWRIYFCIWFDLRWLRVWHYTIKYVLKYHLFFRDRLFSCLVSSRKILGFGRFFSTPITTWFGLRYPRDRTQAFPCYHRSLTKTLRNFRKMTEPTRIEKYVYSSHAINTFWKENLCPMSPVFSYSISESSSYSPSSSSSPSSHSSPSMPSSSAAFSAAARAASSFFSLAFLSWSAFLLMPRRVKDNKSKPS